MRICLKKSDTIVNMKSSRAFTLIELMVTILIVGILGAVAIAGYNRYVDKTKLVEAYTGVDTMTKQQTAYFLENKTFYYLDANPGVQIDVPGVSAGGIKGTMLDGMYVYNHLTGWDVVGYPFATGTKLLFSYRATVGRTDGSGNEVAANTGTDPDDNRWVAVSGALSYHYRAVAPTVANPCASTHIDQYVTAAGKITYNWAFIHASRDFRQKSDTLCTDVFRVLDTGSTGKVTAGPIQAVNAGE